MAANDMEMEIKLVAAVETVWTDLFTLPLITETTVNGSVAERALESHYFDTPEGGLARLGYAYRIRRTPDGLIATLKAAGHMEGGLAHRPEFETTVPDLKPDLSVFDGQAVGVDLPALIGEAPLGRLFTVDVVRRQRQLQLTPETLVEMAVDFGRILAEDKETPVAEVEFEMITGSTADLLEFLAKLTRELPFYVAFKSKFRRGTDLLLSVHELEDPSLPIVLKEDESTDEALYVLLAEHIGAMLQEQRRFDEEGSGMTAFGRLLQEIQYWLAFAKPMLKPEAYERYQQQTAQLATPFETLYHIEALTADWTELHRSPLPLTGSVVIENHLAEKRRDLITRILQEKQNGVYTRTLFDLWSWAATHPWAEQEMAKISCYARERLNKWFNDLQLTADHKELDAAAGCALFRIAHKSVSVAGCLKQVLRLAEDKPYIRLKSMQKRLWEIYNDECGKAVLQSLVKTGASRLLYRDAGLLAGWRLRAVQDDLPEAEKRWKRFLAATRKHEKRKTR